MDPLEELADWLPAQRKRIEGQVRVQKRRDRPQRTKVAIDHRFPCPVGDHVGWHVTTREALLPRPQFSSYAASHLRNAARHGRAIYCHDPLLNEAVAALAFHIDERVHLPFLITDIAFRTEPDINRLVRDRSLCGALVLKHHAHALAAKLGRGGHVDVDLRNDDILLDYAGELGFKKAPNLKGFRPSGVHLRQGAPV
jgi:hypothetical protein